MKKSVNRLIALFFILAAAFMLVGCSYFYIPNYTVTFLGSKGGSEIKTVSFRSVKKLSFPVAEAIDGYEFKGYKNDKDDSVVYEYGKENDFSGLELDRNNVFYAFFGIKEYRITYDLDGGSIENEVKSYTVEDETFSLPKPEKDGFVFVGWKSSLNPESPVDTVTIKKGSTGDLSFTAVWGKDKYYLNFDLDGGSGVSAVSDENNVFLDPGEPVKGGYLFNGWRLDGKKITFPFTAESRVTTVKAEWSAITYKITCPLVPGFETINYTADESVTVPDAEKEGYTFVGYKASDSDEPKKPFVVKKGTYGDIELIPVFRVNTYTITFDSTGGSEVGKSYYEYASDTVEPTEPTREYCTFLGWYEDEACTVKHVFGKMPAKNITLYAKWYSDKAHTLVYSVKNSSATVDCDVKSGQTAVYCETVSLSVPAIAEDGVFSQWNMNGKEYSLSHDISFVMPDNAVTLEAVYKKISNTLSFVKSSGDDLLLPYSDVGFIAGENITAADYTTGNTACIKSEFLSGLGNGVYPFYYSSSLSAKEGEYFLVCVSDTTTIKNLRFDFDVNYPDVTIKFDAEKDKDYEYSFDGGKFQTAYSGAIIKSIYFGKSIDHTITVRSTSDFSDSVTLTKKGVSFGIADYYGKTFEYGGQKYDYVAETEEELEIICQYVAYVEAPLGKKDLAEGFAVSRGITSDVSGLVKTVINRIGIPYSPLYSNPSNIRLNDYYSKSNFIISMKNSTPNKYTSTQQKVEVSDAQKLLSSSSRTGKTVFKIDGYERSQQIRTIYELENLPYGVAPSGFADTAKEAEEVYNEAKNILSSIVDDGMNDYEKIAAIYDYLALNVTYDDVVAQTTTDTTIYRAFTTAGALLDKIAVCDGIAGAFRLMASIEGIEAEEISGTGNGGGHAWNKYKINDIWYAADATWSKIGLTSGGTTTYLVNHNYLFMDEVNLRSTAHIENDNSNLSSTYLGRTKTVALNAKDYFDLNLSGGVHLVKSEADIKTLAASVKSRGATAIELKSEIPSSLLSNTETLIRKYFGVGCSVFAPQNGNPCYYILF